MFAHANKTYFILALKTVSHGNGNRQNLLAINIVYLDIQLSRVNDLSIRDGGKIKSSTKTTFN